MKTIFTTLLLSAHLFASDIYATFNVKANQEAVLAFTASGTIEKRYVDVGSHVKKGTLLASLENSEQALLVNLAQEDLAHAKLQEDQSRNSLERFTQVKEMIDEEKFEQISFGAQMATVNAKKAALNLKLKNAQLDKTLIHAPFGGVITARYKDIGDSVTGMQVMPVFEIMDTSVVKLVLDFDEKYAQEVSIGDTFIYTVDGIKGEQMGTIAKIYPTANPKTRKITAEVHATGLLPGLFGTGIIKAK